MSIRRLPLGTLVLVGTAVACEFSPLLSRGLDFERAAIANGELWRVFTGHLVHRVPGLALLDLFVLAVLGAWIERRSRRVLVSVLIASALAASCAVLLVTSYERYLGSSALGCGLLAAACVLTFRAGRQRLALAAGLLFAVKLAFEGLGFWPAGLGALPPGSEPALAAHVGGALGGSVAALVVFRLALRVDEPRTQAPTSRIRRHQGAFASRAS